MRPRVPALKDNMRKPIKKALKYMVGGYPQIPVGKMIAKGGKKALNWAAGQMEKEWRGEDQHIEDFKKKQKARGLIN